MPRVEELSQAGGGAARLWRAFVGEEKRSEVDPLRERKTGGIPELVSLQRDGPT